VDPVEEYVAALAREPRALLERLQRLVGELHPDAELRLSYRMPTWVVGDRRLIVGAWKHGLSVYGWEGGTPCAYAARHPELDNGKGTLRLPHREAAEASDDELRELVRALLGPSPGI
jgi:uncharacterized protein YdhG (YjbR/CyaY superfamily)